MAEADSLARAALRQFPACADAQHVIGLVAMAQGRLTEAEAALAKAVKLAPKAAPIVSNRGIVLLRMGRAQDALRAFDKAVALAPQAAEAHSNRGSALGALGRHSDAIAAYDRALQLRPDFADALLQRALSISNLSGPAVGLDALVGAVRRFPGRADIAKAEGDLLRQAGRGEDAIAAYERGVAAAPEDPDVRGSLAIALLEFQRFADAEAQFETAIARGRNGAVLRAGAACALVLGRPKVALERADAAVSAGVADADVFDLRARALAQLGRSDEALQALETASALGPQDPEFLIQKGIILRGLGRREDALAALRAADELASRDGTAAWLAALTEIPAFSSSANDRRDTRQALASALAGIGAAMVERPIPVSAVGRLQPFFLAYQEDNNRDLLTRYGDIVCAVMAPLNPSNIAAALLDSGERLRLGIVSSKFHSHSVFTALTRGFIAHMDPAKIEVIAFDTGRTEDDMTAWTRNSVARYVSGVADLDRWVRTIRQHQPHALLYPEIGMDQVSLQLAALRLAPYQLATWGHPETTGLATIDTFVSAEALEPPGAEANYRESLLRLPGVGCSYPRSRIVPADMDITSLGLTVSRPVFLCPGVPFKYQPQHDDALVEIALALGEAQFIFFAPDNHRRVLFELTQQRIGNAFRRAGLDPTAYLFTVPWLSGSQFQGLMQVSTAMLDTIGFSGFNTAMQAVENGLPIVTVEGRFMRGRLASGLLREIGLGDFVCPDIAAYVEEAVVLARDTQRRRATGERMKAGLEKIIDDPKPARALQDHLIARFQPRP